MNNHHISIEILGDTLIFSVVRYSESDNDRTGVIDRFSEFTSSCRVVRSEKVEVIMVVDVKVKNKRTWVLVGPGKLCTDIQHEQARFLPRTITIAFCDTRAVQIRGGTNSDTCD